MEDIDTVTHQQTATIEPIDTPDSNVKSAPMTDQEKLMKTHTKLERMMYEPISRKDMEYMMAGKTKVISYEELHNFQSLGELLSPYQNVVVLYSSPSNPDVGHWCCMFASGDYCEFFDSYGCMIDDKIQQYNEYVQSHPTMHKQHVLEPVLLHLLLNSEYADNFHYNEFVYQSKDYQTATCGYWCILRLKNKHMNEYQFSKLYYDLPHEYDIMPDEFAVARINTLFPEIASYV
jgi:hypothetical protein